MFKNRPLRIFLAAGFAAALIFATIAATNFGALQVLQKATAADAGSNSNMPSATNGSTTTAQDTNGNMTMPPGPPIGNERRVVLTGTLAGQSSGDPNFYMVDILPARQDGFIYNGL